MASAVVNTVCPVASFLIDTAAFGITAPRESATVPCKADAPAGTACADIIAADSANKPPAAIFRVLWPSVFAGEPFDSVKVMIIPLPFVRAFLGARQETRSTQWPGSLLNLRQPLECVRELCFLWIGEMRSRGTGEIHGIRLLDASLRCRRAHHTHSSLRYVSSVQVQSDRLYERSVKSS
jgi:hypothetical protein